MCRHAHTLYVGICVSQFMCRSQRTTRKDLFCLPLPCGSCKFNWVIRLAASSFTQWAITPASSEVVNRFVSRCSCSREVCSYDLIILPPYGSSVFEDLCCRNSCGVSGTWCVCGSRAEALLRPLQVVSLVKPLNMSSKRPERTSLVYPGQARPGQMMMGGNWMLYGLLWEDTSLRPSRGYVVGSFCKAVRPAQGVEEM